MEKKIKHLEMIQNIITRMSGNLFLLKGWAITLIVALFTFIAKENNNVYILFAFCVLFVFWILDGFFLSMERCFRELYKEICNKSEEEINFIMNYKKYQNGKNSWFRSIFSKTLSIFYGALLLVMIITIIFSKYNIKMNFDIQNKKIDKQSVLSLDNFCEKIKNKI